MNFRVGLLAADDVSPSELGFLEALAAAPELPDPVAPTAAATTATTPLPTTATAAAT